MMCRDELGIALQGEVPVSVGQRPTARNAAKAAKLHRHGVEYCQPGPDATALRY